MSFKFLISNFKLWAVSLITVVIFAHLFFTDFNFVKKFIGDNAPEFKEPETVSVDGGELPFLDIPEGFEISVVARGLENPRVIVFDSKGRMLISETKAGRVSILDFSTVLGASGGFENKRALVDGLKSPHGLDFYKDPKTGVIYLYIAEAQQVSRYIYDINTGKLTDTVGKNITNLPA